MAAVTPTLPTARQSLEMALHLARALGANLIPCSVDSRRPLVKWSGLHSPGSPRVSEATLAAWGQEAARRERDNVPTAWALLPGSARLVALDVDEPAQVGRLLEIHGETPLIVRSPTVGRAHLWYRWPHGTDVGSVSQESLPGYAVKARGAMIHAPGVLHRSMLGWYRASLPIAEWTPDLVQRLPFLDLAALDEDRRGRMDIDALAGGPECWADEDEAVRRGRAWLQAAEHSIGGREGKTFHAALTLGDFGVPLPVAERLIVEWDGAAPSPRGAVAVCETVSRAYASRRLPAGCRRVGDSGDVDAAAIFSDLKAGAF
jgi:hypothetical protein